MFSIYYTENHSEGGCRTASMSALLSRSKVAWLLATGKFQRRSLDVAQA